MGPLQATSGQCLKEMIAEAIEQMSGFQLQLGQYRVTKVSFLSFATLHTSMVLNLRIPSPASSLFHQVLLLALEVMPAYRKIVRPLRMSTQIVRW